MYHGCLSASIWTFAQQRYDYVHIAEDTILEAIRRYTKAEIEIFGSEYFRALNDEDTKRAWSEERGWLGMLGSIDCMHLT